MSLPQIQYPYKPEGGTYSYVEASHPFMLAAKEQRDSAGCRKHATGAVIVKDGQIVARGANAGIYVTICPRVYKGYGTGQGYEYCKNYCAQDGHAEVMAVRDAKANGLDVAGADIYLYGHWWACKNCWDTLLAVGIKNVIMTNNSHEVFNDQARNPGEFDSVDLKVYISGPLTRLADQSIKLLYERISALAEAQGFEAHVPHLHTDPIANADVTPAQVYSFDSGHVKDADVLVAYVGETSLGVGMELEMAAQHKALIVLLSETGKPVSRLVLGNPAVIEHIQFDSHDHALELLKPVLAKLISTAKKKNQSTL